MTQDPSQLTEFPQLEQELQSVRRSMQERLQQLVSQVVAKRILSLNKLATQLHKKIQALSENVNTLRKTTPPDPQLKDKIRQIRVEFLEWFLKEYLEKYPSSLGLTCSELLDQSRRVLEIGEPLDQGSYEVGHPAFKVMSLPQTLRRLGAAIRRKQKVRIPLADLNALLNQEVLCHWLNYLRLVENHTVQHLITIEEIVVRTITEMNLALDASDGKGKLPEDSGKILGAAESKTQGLMHLGVQVSKEIEGLSAIDMENALEEFSTRIHNSASLYLSPRQINRRAEKLSLQVTKYESQAKSQSEYIQIFVNSMYADFVLYILSYNIGFSWSATFNVISNANAIHFEQKVRHILKAIDELTRTLDSSLNKTEKTLTSSKIREVKSIIMQNLQSSSDDLQKMISGDQLQEPLNQFAEQISKQVDELRNIDFTLQDEHKNTSPVKPSEYVELPLRKIIKSYLSKRILDIAVREVQSLEESYRFTSTELLRFKDIIDFNMELAVDELELDRESDEELKSLTLGALDRLKLDIEDRVGQKGAFLSEIDTKVSAEMRTSFNKIRTLIEEKNPLDLKVFQLKRSSGRKFEKWLSRMQDYAGVIIERIQVYSRWMVGLIVRKKSLLSSRLGFEEMSQARVLEIKDQANIQESITDALPFIYKKLFTIEPVSTINFLISRREEIKAFTEAFERWDSKKESSISIFGEAGSGKSSLINYVSKSIFQAHPVYQIELSKTTIDVKTICRTLSDQIDWLNVFTLEELQAQLKGRRCIIIIENAENLYLRKVHGMRALEELLQSMAKSLNDVFWVFSFRKQAWRFLEKSMGISAYFYYQLETTSLSRESMQELIMVRHNISGYRLQFEETAAQVKDKEYRRAKTEEEKQQILQDKYFDALMSVSKGNPILSIFYWIRSIEKYESNKIYVKQPSRLEYGFIKRLDPDQVFMLAAMIQHSNLSLQNAQDIFNLSHQQCRMHMETLENKGLAIKIANTNGIVDADEIYMINPIAYHEILNMLRSKNILTG